MGNDSGLLLLSNCFIREKLTI